MIDTHAHLNDSAFDQDRREVLERARQSGVHYIIDVSEDAASAKKSLELFEKEPSVWSAVGFHPHAARILSDQELNEMECLLKNKKVIGVGEIGLDYYYEKQPRDIQKKAFESMLNLALKHELPVMIHNRDSDEDLLGILGQSKYQAVKGIIHCFTAGWETAEALLDLGFYISFSGIVTFKKAEVLREVVRKVPLDRLLFETDSPYLSPEPHRGQRNEPSFVIQTAQAIAKIKGLEVEELNQVVTDNARRLFSFCAL